MNNDIKFLNIEWSTRYSLTIFGLYASVIFRLEYVWFLVHLYIGLFPNSCGQLAELIADIIPLEKICIVNRPYWMSYTYPTWSTDPMYDDHPPEVHNEPEEPATVNQPKETIKRDELKNPKWIEDDRLGDGPIKFLPEKESRFFTELIQKYLKPLLKNKVEEEKVQMALLVSEQKGAGLFLQ